MAHIEDTVMGLSSQFLRPFSARFIISEMLMLYLCHFAPHSRFMIALDASDAADLESLALEKCMVCCTSMAR